MSATTEHKIALDLDAIAQKAAIPAVEEPAPPTVTDSIKEDIATIKQAIKTVLGVAGVLFLLAVLFSHNNSAPAPAVPAAAAPAAPAAPALVGTPGGSVVSFPKGLTAHHFSGSDYSLTWKSMGDGYTYRVYYANDQQMHDATAALYKPVDGTTYRFDMNGDPKNVWMAVAPVDANGNEGLLSRPINIGNAHKG